MRLEILEDAEAVAAAAAERLAAASGHVALAGGSTPKRAYALAAERREDWRGVTLWLGDERLVPDDDERSNAAMVREHLLTRIARSRLPGFEPVCTELSLEAAADDYDARLRAAGGALELALLGLGPDSHTASLFPGKPALEETRRLAVGVPEPGMEPHVARVTMTFPAFAAAREVVFLVAGEDKAEALARAFGAAPDPAAPAGRIRPASGDLVVLADKAAAKRI